MKNIPKVFISYSWTPTSNKIRVEELEYKLLNDNVSVIRDEISLLAKGNKNKFMELINDPSIDKVLIICNEDYFQKSKDTKGGVAIEYDMISNAINENLNTNRFIPILFEKKDGVARIPEKLKSFIYIDFSNDGFDEQEYQNLLIRIGVSTKPTIHLKDSKPKYTSYNKRMYKEESEKKEFLIINTFSNPFDSLLFIKEQLSTQNTTMTWKWIIIAAYHSLYMFCIDALHFGNPDDVTSSSKEDVFRYVKMGNDLPMKMEIVKYEGLEHAFQIKWKYVSEEEFSTVLKNTSSNAKDEERNLISFWTALARIQDNVVFMKRFVFTKGITISLKEMQLLEYLYYYRNEIMNFVPSTSLITVEEIKLWIIVALGIIKRIVMESKTIDFFFEDVKEKDVSNIIDEIITQISK